MLHIVLCIRNRLLLRLLFFLLLRAYALFFSDLFSVSCSAFLLRVLPSLLVHMTILRLLLHISVCLVPCSLLCRLVCLRIVIRLLLRFLSVLFSTFFYLLLRVRLHTAS